jgi:hypothetical protein
VCVQKMFGMEKSRRLKVLNIFTLRQIVSPEVYAPTLASDGNREDYTTEIGEF